MKTIRLWAAALMPLVATSALAEGGLALLIGNQDYKSLRDMREAAAPLVLERVLRDRGYEVLALRDVTSDELLRRIPQIQSAVDEADRVIVFLAGHVVSTDGDSWLLTTDAGQQGALAVGLNGLSLHGLTEALADKAGAAVVLVGRGSGSQPAGPGLRYGYEPRNIAQGVTVFTGATLDLMAVVRDGLLAPGQTTRAIAEEAPGSVAAFGFVSDAVAFTPPPPPEAAAADDSLEAMIWNQARTSNDPATVQVYLDRFPEGAHADEARALLAQLSRSPADIARETEEALHLSRDARREIQQNLSLLGFDTRGIDGIFGRGTRGAITAWQRSAGLGQTGYLDRDQIAKLEVAAVARARELEEEARRRKEEEDRQDAAFWSATGSTQGEDGLRAYLKRYPDGLFSDIARDRLEVFEAERRKTAALAEANAWDAATQANTVEAYQDYLAKYPKGTFAESAQEKIDELNAQAGEQDVIAQAMAEEEQLLANPLTRLLVEKRLNQMGFDPGKADGVIDNDTRKAVRRFQKANDLVKTGYFSRETVVRLLAAAQGG